MKINLDMKGELECGWVVGNKRPRRPTSSFQGSKRLLWSYIISERATKIDPQIFLHSLFQFVLQLRGNSVWRWPLQQPRTRFKAKSYLDFETDAFKLLLIKNHFFPILLANFSKLLFSRLGLLPVLVLLLYNPDYHRFRGLCGSSTGAQLDKKSWLCCHQVCSWLGQRVRLILEININGNTQ